jgi:hypothetical protein
MIETFVSNIENKVPFTFSRWGDGEWKAVFNSPGSNCDGHEYFPDLCEALRNVLLGNPKYLMGMQNFAVRRMGDQIEQFLLDHDLNIDWLNADVFHHASIKGRFTPFIEAISKRSLVLVGPAPLRNLKLEKRFIEIPEKNCWLDRTNITRLVDLSLRNEKEAVVLFCASMASNVIIHDLYQLHGTRHTFLDMGSVFMPYVGVANRSYHKDVITKLQTA